MKLFYIIMVVNQDYRTTDEWESLIGQQIRAERIASNLDQEHLANLANISIGALSNLERGKGSSLKTLISVIKALGRTDWFQALAPSVEISPMQLLTAGHKTPRQRVRSLGQHPLGDSK